MKKKKRCGWLLAFLSFALLSGCWDIKNIDQRTLPVVVGISMDNHGYNITLQIPISGKEADKSRIVSERGDSVSSVFGKIRMNAEKAIDYSHIRLIIIHHDLVSNKERMNELANYFLKSKELPSRVMMAITDDPIDQLLSSINGKLGVNATAIYDYFNKGAGWSPDVSGTRIWEVYRSLYSYTEDIAIPIISVGRETVLTYKGAAIFKNGELTERIGAEESSIINLFQKHNVNGKIESLDGASIMVTSSAIQNKAAMKKNTPVVLSAMNVKFRVLERKEGISNTVIAREFEKLMEGRFRRILEQSQKSHTDIFGFGQYFRQKIPFYDLKNWREKYYPKLDVRFQVHASIE